MYGLLFFFVLVLNNIYALVFSPLFTLLNRTTLEKKLTPNTRRNHTDYMEDTFGKKKKKRNGFKF